MDSATAITGPALASKSAIRGFNPRDRSNGFNPLRTQNRNASDAPPMIRVIQLIASTSAIRLVSMSIRLCPSARTPRMCFICEVAMRTPDAVMNPAITGCDRKFARNPSRNNPITSSINPERKASVIAAMMYSGVPCAASFPAAAAVISETTATGPTASVRDVPKIA